MGWVAKLSDQKKSEADVHTKELYEKMVEYSKVKNINDLQVLAVHDSDGDSGLQIVLEFCAILYQPENCRYYASFNEDESIFEQKGMNIPVWLPQNNKELVDNCTGLCYGMMLGCLSGQERYLTHPLLNELEKNINQLCLEECMQFFLFYNRLSLRYGQQYFFEKWKDGTALRVVKRIQRLRVL